MRHSLKKPGSPSKLPNQHFTITEMLVVVGVIAILGAILGTFLMKGLEQADEITCGNTTRQLLGATLNLTNDTPITGIPGVKGIQLPKVQDSTGETWMDKLAAYGVADPASFHCAQAARSNQPSYGLNPLCGAEWMYSSAQLSGFLLMPAETRPRNFALIKKPGQTVLIVESGTIESASAAESPENWLESTAGWQPYAAFALTDTTSLTRGKTFDFGYNWGNTVSSSRRGSMTWNQYVRPLGRHGEEKHCTSGFVDGHVEFISISKLVTPQWKSADCLFDNE